MKNKLLSTLVGIGMALLLGACNVGSDEGQQASATSSNTNGTSNLSPASTQKLTSVASSEASSPMENYYLLLQGVDSRGQAVSHAILFQRQVSAPDNPVVQLSWFEPDRNPDGSCLHNLSAYQLKYGQQANSYNTSLNFDLAARDMSCTSVGTTECGDVRECHYKLSL